MDFTTLNLSERKLTVNIIIMTAILPARKQKAIEVYPMDEDEPMTHEEFNHEDPGCDEEYDEIGDDS